MRTNGAYKAWLRVFGHSSTRIFPILQQTQVRHGPAVGVAAKAHSNSAATSYNWSGEALTNGATSFGTSSFSIVYGEWNVPIAQSAFGVCNNGGVYSSTWIGIDGYVSSPDVFQAGTESDANCTNAGTSTTYYPWYEWYPNSETKITNLAISPGDIVDVVIQATSSTQGAAYILNATTSKSVFITFSAPSGTSLVGNTAEWIVERPSLGGSLTTLQNYVADYLASTITTLNNSAKTVYYGGVSAPGVNAYTITMLDNNKQPISFPVYVEPDIFGLHDEGSAK